MKRPGGATAISILLWFVGVVNLISGVAAMDELSPFWGLLQVAIGGAAVACGLGIWRLREWARKGTMALMGLNAVSLIGIWIQYSDRIIVSRVVVPLLVNVIVIFYLLQPPVRATFSAAAPPPPAGPEA